MTIEERAKELYDEGKSIDEINETLKLEYPGENFEVIGNDNADENVNRLVENRINSLFEKLEQGEDVQEELDILLKHYENLEKIKIEESKQEQEKEEDKEKRKEAIKEALIKGGFALGGTILSVGAWIGISLLTGRLESTGTLFRSCMGKNKPIKF